MASQPGARGVRGIGLLAALCTAAAISMAAASPARAGWGHPFRVFGPGVQALAAWTQGTASPSVLASAYVAP